MSIVPEINPSEEATATLKPVEQSPVLGGDTAAPIVDVTKSDEVKKEKAPEVTPEAEEKPKAPIPEPTEDNSKKKEEDEEKEDPKEAEYKKNVNRTNDLIAKKPKDMLEALHDMLDTINIVGPMLAERTGIKEKVAGYYESIKEKVAGLFNKSENDDEPNKENTGDLKAGGDTAKLTETKDTIITSITEGVKKIDSNQPTPSTTPGVNDLKEADQSLLSKK